MKIKLKDARVAFLEIWKAKEFKTGDGKPRYSSNFLIEPGSENDKLIQETIDKVIADKFDNAAKAKTFKAGVAGQKNQYCYLSGDGKEYDGFAGNMVLAAHRKESDGPATIVDRDRRVLEAKDGRPYAGCYVDAFVDIYVQTGENPGVRASFSGIQFRRDGDPFSGGAPSKAEDFDDLSEGADADSMV
jgi:ssDNA-binding protein